MMCHSIKEKVLSLNNDNKKVKSVKKGNCVIYTLYVPMWLYTYLRGYIRWYHICMCSLSKRGFQLFKRKFL